MLGGNIGMIIKNHRVRCALLSIKEKAWFYLWGLVISLIVFGVLFFGGLIVAAPLRWLGNLIEELF